MYSRLKEKGFLFSLKGKGFLALGTGYKGTQRRPCRVKQARYQRRHTYIILYPWTGQPVVTGTKLVDSRSCKEVGWGDTVEWTQGFSFSEMKGFRKSMVAIAVPLSYSLKIVQG